MNYKLQIKILTICAIFIIYHLSFVVPVFAHVLQSDGSVGAVLHINPDDDPIVGQPAYLVFEIKDKTGKLNPKNCDCQVVITEDGNTVHQQELFMDSSSIESAQHVFTFPQKDIYQIVVTGKPLVSGDFQEFKLTYDLRVSREDNSTPQSSTNQTNWIQTHLIQTIGAIALGTFLVGAFMLQKVGRFKK